MEGHLVKGEMNNGPNLQYNNKVIVGNTLPICIVTGNYMCLGITLLKCLVSGLVVIVAEKPTTECLVYCFGFNILW